VEFVSVTPQKFVHNYVVISDCRKLYKIVDLALVSNATTRNRFHTFKFDSDETHTNGTLIWQAIIIIIIIIIINAD
jgi:hypothetical protein